MLNKLIIGTVQFGLDYGITNQNGKVSQEELSKIFSFCNENNITDFDTAQDYGSSENIISEYCALYSSFKVITKCKFKGKSIEETVNISLKKFTSIECFMLHSFEDYNKKEIIDSLEAYKMAGKINKIGVSIYNVDESILLLRENKIDVVQLPFNYLDRQWDNTEFQKLVKETKIEIHVRSVFLQGILLNPVFKIPNNIDKNDFLELNNIIDEITRTIKMSKLELCFAYINSFDWVNKFLIGVDNFNHLLLNYEIIKQDLTLTEEQINIIHNKTKNINSIICNPSKWSFN